MFGNGHCFIHDEGREYVFQRLSTLRGSVVENVPGNTVLLVNNNIDARQFENEKKLASNILQRFKKIEIFSGNIGEHNHDYLNNYEKTCSNYVFSEEQIFCFSHNIFDAEAKQFYRDTIVSTSSTYDDAKQLFISKYRNITKQNRIRRYLQNLTLKNVMDKKSCDFSEALEELRNKITKLAPQRFLSYCKEDIKVEYSYNAVVGNEWCKIPFTQCIARNPP